MDSSRRPTTSANGAATPSLAGASSGPAPSSAVALATTGPSTNSPRAVARPQALFPAPASDAPTAATTSEAEAAASRPSSSGPPPPAASHAHHRGPTLVQTADHRRARAAALAAVAPTTTPTSQVVISPDARSLLSSTVKALSGANGNSRILAKAVASIVDALPEDRTRLRELDGVGASVVRDHGQAILDAVTVARQQSAAVTPSTTDSGLSTRTVGSGTERPGQAMVRMSDPDVLVMRYRRDISDQPTEGDFTTGAYASVMRSVRNGFGNASLPEQRGRRRGSAVSAPPSNGLDPVRGLNRLSFEDMVRYPSGQLIFLLIPTETRSRGKWIPHSGWETLGSELSGRAEAKRIIESYRYDVYSGELEYVNM